MEYSTRSFSIHRAGSKVNPDGSPHQEDSIYPDGGATAGCRVFVVCDGLGGHDDGEVASQAVASTLGRLLDDSLRRRGGSISAEDVADAVDGAYDALNMADTHAARKMGTTMAALVLADDSFTTAHIGDSRVYHIRPGADADSTRILFCTEDHSLANAQRRSGKPVTETRHVITRAMQPNDKRTPAEVHTSTDVRRGDYFMVCSHGLLEKVDTDMIRYVFSQAAGNERNKKALLDRACNGCRDNYSALVVRIDDPDPENKPQRQNMRNTATTRSSGPLAVKLLFALMILLTAIMVIYYLFIHHDEAPPRAGTAIDATTTEEVYEPEESYGYETEPTTRTDDENVGEGTENTEEQSVATEDGADTEAPAPAAEPEAPAAPAEPESPATPEPETTGPIINV